ncbi:MAG: GGDEF domain-containing protein [Clostridiaceae bacterium]
MIIGMGDRDCTISAFGEFKDRELEKEFINHYLRQNTKYMRPIILALGLIYWFFIIPDYFIIKSNAILTLLLINRTVFLLSMLIFYFIVRNIRNYIHLTYWITFYEVFFVISFLLTYVSYESPNFLIQAFGVIVIILGLSQLPNKWINTLVTDIVISIGFTTLSQSIISDLKFMEYSAGIAYILLVIFITSLASLRINYFNRKQYIYSQELLHLSNTDPLTGVYNRAKLNDELDKLIELSKRYKTPFSFVIFDFDNFKNINDNYGHLTGDEVLKETIKIIVKSIRKNDILARWGGEEFVLLLPNTTREQSIEMTKRLKCVIANNSFGNLESITCSFGLASYEESDTSDTLMTRADKFLYKAKSEGKNKIVC